MTEIQLPKRFSIRDLLKRAWAITSNNLGKIILYGIVLLLAFLILNAPIFIIFPADPEAEPVRNLVGNFLSEILALAFGLGITNLALRFSNHENVALSDFFSKFNRFGTYILATALYWLAVAVGLILLIVPGIIIAVRFSLYPYFIIDQNLGVIASLEKSWESVKGATWKVFCFSLVSTLIILLGLLLLGVGIFITFPVAIIAQALLYRTLWNQTNVTVLADETRNELPR